LGGKIYAEAAANVEVVIQEWIETAKKLGRNILTDADLLIPDP
jgi:hypothetical protein